MKNALQVIWNQFSRRAHSLPKLGTIRESSLRDLDYHSAVVTPRALRGSVKLCFQSCCECFWIICCTRKSLLYLSLYNYSKQNIFYKILFFININIFFLSGFLFWLLYFTPKTFQVVSMSWSQSLILILFSYLITVFVDFTNRYCKFFSYLCCFTNRTFLNQIIIQVLIKCF